MQRDRLEIAHIEAARISKDDNESCLSRSAARPESARGVPLRKWTDIAALCFKPS
jgi:hypothetical protein